MADILTAVQLIIKYSRNKRGKSGATAKVSNCKILKQPSTQHVQSAIFEHPPPTPPQKKKTSLGSEHFSLLAKDTFLRFIGHSFLGHRLKHVPQWHFTYAMIKQRRQAQTSNERSNFQLCFFHFVCFFYNADMPGRLVTYSIQTRPQEWMGGWMKMTMLTVYICVCIYI